MLLFWLYNLLFPVILLVMLPYYLFRMCRRGGYARNFLQRLGRYDESTRSRLAEGDAPVWVHAVSVGETYVALKFMEEWRRARPSLRFVMSVNTSTAHALAAKALSPPDVLVYFPLDFPLVTRVVLARVRPRMLVLTECEFWPNLIRACWRRGIPVMLVNGRMSDRSFRGYQRFRSLFSRVLGMFTRLCLQGEQDRERYAALGALPATMVVTGSAKFDVALAAPGEAAVADRILQAARFSQDDLILVGGSTWPGEEAILLDFLVRARAAYPRLKMVLVPRHAERRDEVVAEIERRQLAYVQRSRGGTAADSGCDVLLVDTTGELRHLYTRASVIFIGKSLTQHGGQNLIEPAACGKPVVVGPNMENFREITEEFKQAQALLQVGSAGELALTLERLLADERLRLDYGARAAGLVSRQRGGILRAVAEAESILAAGQGEQEADRPALGCRDA